MANDEPEKPAAKKKIYKSRFAPASQQDLDLVKGDSRPTAKLAYTDAIRALQGDGPEIPQAGTDRWLWGNGIMSEGMKMNLVIFGYVAHPKVTHVEVVTPEFANDSDNRYILFKIWMPAKEVKRYLADRKKLKKLAAKTNLFWRWRLVKHLEKTDFTDVDRNVRRGVREYLGEGIPVIVDVLPEETRV